VHTYQFAGTRWCRDVTNPGFCDSDAERCYSQAYVLYKEGHYLEAFEAFQSVAQRPSHPYVADSKLMAGIIQTRWGFESGESWIRAAIRLKPRWEHAHVTLVWHYCRMGKHEWAESYAESLSKLDFATGKSWDALREVRRIEQELREREERRKKRAELWPGILKAVLVTAMVICIVGVLVCLIYGIYDSAWARNLRHTGALARRLSASENDMNLTLEEVRGKLLAQVAKADSAQLLQEVLLDSHVQHQTNSLRGIEGTLEIYRRALQQLDQLALEQRSKDQLREQLEDSLIQMTEKLEPPT